MGYMLFEPCLMDSRQRERQGKREREREREKKKGSTLEEAWPRPAFGK